MLSRSSDDVPEPIGASAAGAAFWWVVLVLRDKLPRLSFHTIKQDPASVVLEVLRGFRSCGEAKVDLGDGCIRGFECISRGRSDGA